MGVAVIVLEQAEQRAKEIAAYAEQSEHWYRPGQTAVPGDLPEHVLLNGNIRAVFCWTVNPENPAEVYRHMSVSVQAHGRFPQPPMVWTLAHFFGFTSAKLDPKSKVVMHPAASWGYAAKAEEGCVIVHELVK